MADYIPYENRVGGDIFDYAGQRISENQIYGVPYIIHMGMSALYPMMIIDSGEDYVDAGHHSTEQNVLETAFQVIIENPEVFFGSEAEMDEDDWDMVYEGYPELSVQMEMMLPPEPIRADDAMWELNEMQVDYDSLLYGLEEDIKQTPKELAMNVRSWEEVPDGAPENASEIASAYEELITALNGDNLEAKEDAYIKVIAELEKLADKA